MSTQACREEAASLYHHHGTQVEIPGLYSLYKEFEVEHFEYFYGGFTLDAEWENWVKHLSYRLSKEQEEFIVERCGGTGTLLKIKKVEAYNNLPSHPDCEK